MYNGKPIGAKIAGEAADNISELFEMNSHGEIDMASYITRNEAHILSQAIDILQEFERMYTIDSREF